MMRTVFERGMIVRLYNSDAVIVVGRFDNCSISVLRDSPFGYYLLILSDLMVSPDQIFGDNGCVLCVV